MKKFLFFIALLSSCSGVKQEEIVSSNCIEILLDDDIETVVKKAAYIVPTDRQYSWQQLEFTAFVHFGINTFTGKEWGTGKEDIALFKPQNLDANQWVKVARSGGMKLVMLTAKHHDGFCLWQTQTTEYSVKNTPWKNGKGDVLRELAEAVKKENLKLGVYLSPADLHELEREGGTYGNGSKPTLRKIPSSPDLQAKADTIFSYELDDYNAFFMNQLYEVLTQYGEISEVWFDGANPKQGTGQEYDYAAWHDMIRHLQPSAVIAIKGPDVRWVGNEAGKSRENEWSVVPLSCKPSDSAWDDAREEDLGSRKKLNGAKYLYWYPAETDTPIREGWFYRDEKQYVKSVNELLDIWYRSVGNNSVLLLNLSPNKHGIIPKTDAVRIQELGKIIKESFSENLLEKVKLTDEKTACILDKDLEKSLQMSANGASLVFTFKEEQEFNRIMLQEDIRNFGQRIEQFSLEIWKNNAWQTVYKGGTVGYKKMGRFPMQKASKIKLQINKARLIPSLGFVGIYKAPELLSSPEISRNKSGMVSIVCTTPDPEIHYTLDGSLPTKSSPEYTVPFYLPKGGIVKAIAMVNNGNSKSKVKEVVFDVAAEQWKIIDASVAAKGFEAEKAIDGDKNTLWHTPWEGEIPKFPHSITIDLGENLAVCGMTYLPRQDGNLAGICTKYKIAASLNGKDWNVLAAGAFANIKNNPVEQTITFPTQTIRFICFTALESIDNQHYLSVAELGIKTRR